MELARGASDGTLLMTDEALRPGPLQPETTTEKLRRCTALAARARIDLLGPSGGDAPGELVELLGEMASWDPTALEAPDATMTVLAAAALQDLAERLDLADHVEGPWPDALRSGIDAALSMLRHLMSGSPIAASA